MADSDSLNSVRLIGRISLWFAVVAFIGLVVVLFLARVPEGDYLSRIQTLAITRERLPWMMLVGGLLLAVGTGLTTWLISLYSSFRIAGPLYRFARNLEEGIRTGKVPPVRIRGSDHLQEECALLRDSVGALYDHYRRLDQLTVDALSAVQNRDTERLSQAIGALREMKGKVRHEEEQT